MTRIRLHERVHLGVKVVVNALVVSLVVLHLAALSFAEPEVLVTANLDDNAVGVLVEVALGRVVSGVEVVLEDRPSRHVPRLLLNQVHASLVDCLYT